MDSKTKKQWILIVGILSVICIVAVYIEYLSDSEAGTYITTKTYSKPTTTTPTSYCYFDFKLETCKNIGFYDAKEGYNFCIATIRVQNNSNTPVSTNAFYWELTTEGITYNPHTATYSDSINYQSVEIKKGGDFTFQIVYEVPDKTTHASLEYAAYDTPNMKRKDNLLED